MIRSGRDMTEREQKGPDGAGRGHLPDRAGAAQVRGGAASVRRWPERAAHPGGEARVRHSWGYGRYGRVPARSAGYFCSTRTQSISAFTPPCATLSTLDWGRPQYGVVTWLYPAG